LTQIEEDADEDRASVVLPPPKPK